MPIFHRNLDVTILIAYKEIPMNKILLAVIATAIIFVQPSVSFADGSRDITVKQRPIYEIKPPKEPKSGLRVSAWVNHGNNTYNSGEEIEVFVRTNRDAYITMINVGSSGSINQIYPNAHQRKNFVKAHTTVKIPGNTAPFVFQASGPRGADLIQVIASESSSPIIPSKFLNKSVVFPKVNRSSNDYAKDITVVLKKPVHQESVHLYNKVIYIR